MDNDLAADKELPGCGIGYPADERSALLPHEQQFATLFPMLQQVHLQQQHQGAQLQRPVPVGMAPVMPPPPPAPPLDPELSFIDWQAQPADRATADPVIAAAVEHLRR